MLAISIFTRYSALRAKECSIWGLKVKEYEQKGGANGNCVWQVALPLVFVFQGKGETQWERQNSHRAAALYIKLLP